MTTELTWSADKVWVMEENGLWEMWLWKKKPCYRYWKEFHSSLWSLLFICYLWKMSQQLSDKTLKTSDLKLLSEYYQRPGCGTRVWLFFVPFHRVWFFLVQKCCDPFKWFDLLIFLCCWNCLNFHIVCGCLLWRAASWWAFDAEILDLDYCGLWSQR